MLCFLSLCLRKRSFNRILRALLIFISFSHITIESKAQNNALSFDGVNDYVSVPALGNNLTQFTIETWFNATAITNSPGLNGLFNTNSWVTGDVHFQINSTRIQLAVNGSTPVEVAYNSITLNTWHHLAVTYNSVTRKVTFYVNGTLLQSVTIATAVPANFTAAEIGAWTTQRYFAGAMEEYRIWNTERTPAQIINNMFSSMTGTEPGLLGSFSFNQGTAGGTNTGINTLINAKGSNNGNLTNFALSGTSSNWVASTSPSVIAENCLIFNGTNNFVSCGSVNPAKFTIEAWALPNAVSADQAVVSTLNTGTNTGVELHIGADGYPYVTIRNGAAWLDIKGPAKAVAGVWIHLAATFDGSTCKLLVNGINVASQTSISYSAGTSPLFLGVRSGPAIYFTGKIDDVRIWNRVVTEVNLLDSLNKPLNGTEKGLLAYYSFNQGTANGINTGLTALLSSTGTNHGALVNFTLSGGTSNWTTAFLSPPASHVTNFAASLVSNKMTLTWTDATGSVIPDGYLIYASKTNSFTNPVDGALPIDDNDLSDGAGIIRVAKGIQTYNGWTNEDINTVYYFRVYPLTNPGILVKYYTGEPVPTIQLTSKQLFAQVTIPSFQSSSQSLWGDYNNDGWLDYIASGYNDGWSTAFLNNKNNTFSANPAFHKENVMPSDWVDINYDGNLDIAAYKRIYLNGSNGALFAEVAMPEPKKFVDIDKDGDLDLIGYIYPSVNLSVLRHNGALGFTEVIGNYFKDTDGSFETLDYNNDGYPDIVISGRYSVDYKLSTTVYRNDGTGRYTEQKQFVLDGLSQTRIKTGDLNSDGRDDIILTGKNNLGKFNLLIYINTDGNSFSKLSIPFQAGIDQGSADMADINNDGLTDIIFAGGNSDYTAGCFKVFKNNGDLTFSEIYDFAGLSSPATADITDFNNDGAIDVILQGNKILQNLATSGNLVPQKVTVASAGLKDNGVLFQWNGSDDKTSSTGLTYNLRIGRTAGSADIQSHTSLPTGQRKQLKPGNMGSNAKYFRPLGPGTYYWSVQAVDNSYKGGPFSTEQSIVVDSVPAGKLQAISSDKFSLKIKWTNGNGTKRALFCKIGTDGTTKPVNNKTYTASVTFGEGDQIGNSGWYCVYNGIGDSVTVQNLTEYNTYVFQAFEYFGNKGAEKYMLKMADGNPAIFGTSGFTKQTDISTADYSKNIFSFGDYNNDGLVDFFVNNDYSGIRIFKNKGNNTFELQTISGIEKLDYGAAVWADFNNDGWLDIIVSGERGVSFWIRPKSIKLYRNDQNNVFTDLSGGTAVIPGLTESAIAAADYDNDGDIDFFVNGTESLWDAAIPVIKSKIYRNNNTPADCFTEQTGINIPALNNGAAVWGDFNNDGWKDLLFSGASQDGFYYLYKLQNKKDNSFSQTVLLKVKSNVSGSDFNNSDIKTLDFDKDGNLDFLIFIGNNDTNPGGAADTTIIFRNNGDGTFAAFNNIEIPKHSSSNRIDIGDYNNDKAEDIIMSTSVNPNLIRLFQNNYPEKSFSLNPDFNFTWATSTESFRDWNSIGFCDYDNDGDADILTTDYNRLYFISNNRVMKSGTFPVNKTPEAPSNVIATQEPGKLIVNWNALTSDETLSLSYNVILSTGSLLLNSPGSNITSGKLLVPAAGNAGLKTFAIFRELPVGTYSIRVQAVDGAFAGGAWSTPVIVELKNTKAFFTFDTVCYNVATKLSDLSTSTKKIASRKWKYNNTVFSTDSVAHFVFPNSGTGNITLVITDGEGTKDSVTHAIKIKARPAASYSATTVCLGSTTTFANSSSRNGAGTVNWNWNYDNGDPASTDSIPLNKVYGLARIYKTKLIVTASNGCADTLAKDVIVGAIPNVITSVSGKTTFCQGDSVQLIAENNPLYNYQWKLDNNDLTSANTSSYKIKLNSGSYSVKVTNPLANCNATSAQTLVNVLPAPVSPFISSSGLTQFCQEDSVILSITNTLGYDYQWKRNGGAVGSNKNSFVAKSTGSVTVTVSNSSGCAANSSNDIPVVVFPKPSVSTISRSGATTFCQGGNVELSVPANAGYIYQWQNSGANIQGATSNALTAINSGVYSLNASNSNGCISKTELITVTALSAPAAPTILHNAQLPVQFCEGDSVRLSVTNTAGYIYHWKLNGGAVGQKSNQYYAKNSGKYNLIVANSNGCSVASSNEVDILVNPTPVSSLISHSGDLQFCEGGSVILSVPDGQGYLYKWKNESGIVTGEVNNTITASNTGKYSLEISLANGCTVNTDPVDVIVKKKPVTPVLLPYNYTPGKCLGENPVRISAGDPVAGYSYQWLKNNNPISGANNAYIEDFLSQGDYRLNLEMNGCSVQSAALTIAFDDAPPKPLLYADGPTVWYLTCSNDSASKYVWYYNDKILQEANKYVYVANQKLGKYSVSVGNAKGCFTISDPVLIPTGATAIEENNVFESLIVYPNPTSGLFNIEMGNRVFGEMIISVLDQSGKIVKKVTAEKSNEYIHVPVDISGFSKGMFFIIIKIKDFTITKKIIIN
jgi:hypothetical protein